MDEDKNMRRRADQVRMGRVVDFERPGILKPFLQPLRLKNQTNVSFPTSELKFSPDKWGNTSWVVSVQRPGLAQPVITAKAEKVAAAELVKEVDTKKPAGAADSAAAAVIAEEMKKNGNGAKSNGAAKTVAGWLNGFLGWF